MALAAFTVGSGSNKVIINQGRARTANFSGFADRHHHRWSQNFTL